MWSDMADFKLELNREGVRQLLRSEEMKNICTQYAQAAQQRCGDGYKSDSYTGTNRVNAMVWADTYEAKVDNSENNTILKALK